MRGDGGAILSFPGVIASETVSKVINKLPSDMSRDAARLLRSYKGYNVVTYQGRIYGVPGSLGRLGGEDWGSGRVANLPGVVIEATVEEVLARLPR